MLFDAARLVATMALRAAVGDWVSRACCRLSALLDLPLLQAARNVVLVAVTASEQVERLRTWASGRCLSASTPGTYAKGDSAKPSRKITRAPSTKPSDN